MAIIPLMTRKRQEIEHKIHAALEDERSKQSQPTEYVRLSSIGKCPRALWALRRGVPEERSLFAPPLGRALMTFSIGHHVECAVIEWLRKAGFDVEDTGPDGKQWEVLMSDGLGVGHMDGIITLERAKALLEVKTAKAKKFDELLDAGSYREWNAGYYDQIQAYMGASHESEGLPNLDECVVVVVCKDDSGLYSEVIRFDSDHYYDLKVRAAVAMQEGMPARPPAMKSQYCKACKYCDVNKWCWGPLAGVEFDD